MPRDGHPRLGKLHGIGCRLDDHLLRSRGDFGRVKVEIGDPALRIGLRRRCRRRGRRLRDLGLGHRLDRCLDLDDRGNEPVAAGGDMVRLEVLFLLLHPTIEHHLRAGRVHRVLLGRVRLQGGNQPLPRRAQHAHPVGRQIAIADLFGRNGNVSGGADRASREPIGIAVIRLVEFAGRQIDIAGIESLCEPIACRARLARSFKLRARATGKRQSTDTSDRQ